jgi:YidC/Oxa1 family membrane protein insertase
MDKNSIIGLILIFFVLMGYSYFTAPTPEEAAKIKQKRDSIENAKIQEISQKAENAEYIEKDSTVKVVEEVVVDDSVKNIILNEKFSDFYAYGNGELEETVIETELLKLTFSNKGAKLSEVSLKDFKTYKGEELKIIEKEFTKQDFIFKYNNREINADDFYFELKEKTDSKIVFDARAESGNFIKITYELQADKPYELKQTIEQKGIAQEVEPLLRIRTKAPFQEKSLKAQRDVTTIYFNDNSSSDYLSETSKDDKSFEKDLKWIGFKQQFFSLIYIADNTFSSKNANAEVVPLEDDSNHVKEMAFGVSLPLKSNDTFSMNIYLGPNHFSTLKAVGEDIEDVLPLGWGIFGWVNRFFIIPMFNFLDNFNINYGIIILLMTIVIKLLLSPLTYKAYLSSAKMKVLKPDIEALNEKFKDADPMKKQQETMALYKRAGVSPFGGCLPMLLQFPILIAMFRFFPASIELRQQSFLWADDLSSFDSIYNLPFDIPFYGDHVSLFTILMTLSTILYTRTNSQMGSSPEMAQMKWMMYLMPVMFLPIFNNYSAALSYYYFLTNIITFGQQTFIQKFIINESALKEKIEENKKKPVSEKKSSFQKRLEDAAKKRGFNPPK